MKRLVEKSLAVTFTFATVAFSVVSCNAVLGFEEASVDPSLPAPGDDGGETGTQQQAVNCDVYCGIVMKNCTGNLAEYLSADICKAMCSHFDVGLPGDTSSDSLACRIYHANNAEADPKVHCKHAGPTGAGHCGTNPCNGFCLLQSALCTGPLQSYEGGELGCRRECVKYKYLSGPDDRELIENGDTLNCRLYHLESAYDPSNPQAKGTHCPHVATVSTTCF